MAQDNNFQEVKRHKRHTSQTAKKSPKPVPTSAAVKLPQKAMLTCNFVAPLRTTDMDMETTDAENILPEQEAPRKPGTVATNDDDDFYPEPHLTPKRPKKQHQMRVRALKYMK
jgi:hypothetical protein